MLSPPPGWLKLMIPGTSTVRRPAAAGRELPSGEPGDRHRLRSVTAGPQGYEPSVPERQHVDVAIVGLPYPQRIEPRRAGDDHDLLAGVRDLLELSSQTLSLLALERVLELVAPATHLRLGIDLAWVEERPFQVRIDQVEEGRKVALGVPFVGLPDEDRVGVRHSITIRHAVSGSLGTTANSIGLYRARASDGLPASHGLEHMTAIAAIALDR